MSPFDRVTPWPGTVNMPRFQETTGTKRRRDTPQKFYAVRIGRTPGIYYSWPDCLQQVTGHPKAIFKSFSSLSEAQSFIEGDIRGSVNKWYGVRVGRAPGVYTDYQDALDQVVGVKGAKYKGFKSKAEAERFVAETEGATEAAGRSDGEPPAKKIKASKGRKGPGVKEENTPPPGVSAAAGELEAGEGPLMEDAEDGFDVGIVLDPSVNGARYRSRAEREKVTYRAARPVAEAPIRIYTDGSSLGNGRAAATAGVGVFFGPGDGRNVSEPLAGSKQTNQRAELTAVVRALELAPRDRRVVIVSDSKYSIDCVTNWFVNWRRNGWLNSSRKPVENRDLVQKILDLLEERLRLNKHRMTASDEQAAGGGDGDKRGYWDRGPGGVRFEWVKGHDKDTSNMAADRLAVDGARAAQQLDGFEDFSDA